MRISTKHDVALGLLRALGHEQRSLESVADELGVSLSYLEQLAQKLRNAGLIVSVRGPGGGYSRPNALEDINLGDVFSAIGTGSAKGTPPFGLFEEISHRLERVPLSELGKKSPQSDHSGVVLALVAMMEMHEKMLEKTNIGASYYDAETLAVMNDAPVQARQALNGIGYGR